MSDGIKRRDFLKVAGTTGVGAGMFGCSTENVERLIPYVVPPDDITPGVATWYATVCGECPSQCGMWVRTREGRAVKVEGNPSHPVSQGALCSRGHSTLQGLYDPDRVSAPMQRQNGELVEIGWEEAENLLAERLGASGPANLLLHGRSGASLSRLMEELQEATGGRRVEYDALAQAPLREATRVAFGRDVVPTFDFEASRLTLSFGADFLETWLSPVEHARGFARSTGATEEGEKGRFVFLGSRLSLTGQNADEWVPIRPGSEAVVALAIAREISDAGGDAGPYQELLQGYDAASAAELAGIPAETLQALAADFAQQPSLAVGPGVAGQHRHATAANLAVLVLNAVAGNVGQTVHVGRPDRTASAAAFADTEDAIAAMQAGEIEVAVVHGANPVYSLPGTSAFAEAFANVPFKVAVTTQMDETARAADLVLPDRHPLEAWGDSSPRPGVYAVQQPVMQPVPHFDSRPWGDVVLSVARRLGHDLGEDTFHDYLRASWQEIHGRSDEAAAGFDAFWRGVLRRGLVEIAGEEEAEPSLQAPDRALTFEPPAFDGDEGDPVLLVHPSSRFGDGSLANRPWLQELPDPVSKIAWHSWLEVNSERATAMGIRNGDIVRVRSSHGEVELPVWTYPGIREDTVALAMGGGHEALGRWAEGRGVNPMRLLPSEAEQPSGGLVHLSTRVTVESTGRRRPLATIEGSSEQFDRPIAPAVQVDALTGEPQPEGDGERLHELQALGGFAPVPTDGLPEDYPLPGAQYGEYDPETTARWSMAIDLDKCTGCSACVTACQAENNIPWVGEDQVLMGRDLHWIRLERYYEGVDASEPGPVDIRFLPMLCQHCGNAPCEPVCPVYAAYHTPDGMNAQVYNRCVGTRYCANNCPYKVRVFNWYRFSEIPEPMNWQYNPDVTVRAEGVMEKCSFCVQRIRERENQATLEGRGLQTDEVVPACQQSCPAEAIVFGNIRDPDSRVAHLARNERTYRVLDVLINTQPAVNYLRKVTFHPVTEFHV